MKIAYPLQLLVLLTLGTALLCGCSNSSAPAERPSPTPTTASLNTPTSSAPDSDDSTTTTHDNDDAEQILNFLRFVPLTLENRRYVLYGNQAAWFESWDIPRPKNADEFMGMGISWQRIWFEQTTPPNSFGIQSYMQEDQKSLYGYDILNSQRSLETGAPPDTISVVQHNADRDVIDEALVELGYAEEVLAEDAMLYSIREDYEFSMEPETLANRMGDRNRLLLIDDLLVAAKATETITTLRSAYRGEQPSLADDPSFIAAVEALTGESMDQYGQLLGTIFYGEMVSPDFGSILLQPKKSLEEIKSELEELVVQDEQLPPYLLNAFATRYREGATYLILATIFPSGVDVAVANETIAERIKTYESYNENIALSEMWQLETNETLDDGLFPVSIVIMRVDDPVASEDEAVSPIPPVLSWQRLVLTNDLGFLTP